MKLLHFWFLLQNWLQPSTSFIIKLLHFWFYYKTGCNKADKVLAMHWFESLVQYFSCSKSSLIDVSSVGGQYGTKG